MFKIIVFFISTLNINLYSQNSIIFSGFSYHFDRVDEKNVKYNEINYGLGYEYNTKSEDSNWFTNYGVMFIVDSYKKPFPFVRVGKEYYLDNLPLSFGVDIFAGIKYDKYEYDQYENGEYYVSGGKYIPIIGFSPMIKYHFEDFSVNLSYLPKFDFWIKDLHVKPPSLLYMTFGYSF